MKKFHITFITFITIIISLMVLFFTTPIKSQDKAIENLRKTSKAFSSVARNVSPSVVFIQVEGTKLRSSYHQFPMPFDDKWPFRDDLFERFFGERFDGFSQPNSPRRQPKIVGQGSGFVFSSKDSLFFGKSYILTNNHVVENAEKIKVTLQDKREFEAQIVGTDPKSDIAVLEIKIDKLPALTLGDSSTLEVGEWVVAIGNPFGLSHTLTVGVVSATGRNSLGINDYEDFIQTDAAINPGNSGGPLVNLDGDVVGINTAIFSKSGGYMGIGFAIPINLADKIAKQLMKDGEITRGYLGILIQDLSPELAKSFDLDKNEGILVAKVTKDSPADKAGIKTGDVIVSFNGKPVSSVGSFRNIVALSPPDTRGKIIVVRNGERVNISVTIGKLTQDQALATQDEQPSEELGLTVENITPYLAEKFDVNPAKGVLITKVKSGSIADMAGLKTGVVILQVNRKNIKNVNDFKRALNISEKDKSVLMLIQKEDSQRYIVLNWS